MTSRSPFTIRQSKFIIIAILLLAAFFRFYRLPTLPPGLNFDEAGNGVAALDILAGEPQVWWRIGGGKEPLWPYLVALSTALLGYTPLALRLPAALLGVLTVAAVYPLLRRMFGGLQSQAIALFTMAGVAVSAWHLHFSRLGFRAVLLPLLAALAVYFFWRMWTARIANCELQIATFPSDLVLAALFFSLAIYAYLAGRLLLVLPLAFVLLCWLLAAISKRVQPADMRRELLLISKFYFLIFLFLIPLMVYFVFNPTDFVARAGTVSIFNPEWNQGDLPGTAWRTFSATLGTFLGLAGDANPLVNLPGQPALLLPVALLFVMGLVTSLYRAARFRPGDGPPHLFLLCWWGIMLLPAILAPEGAPHHLRLIGTLIPTYAFIAIGLSLICGSVAHYLPAAIHQTNPLASRPPAKPGIHPTNQPAIYPAIRRPILAICSLLPAAVYLLLALQTYNYYFVRWPQLDFTLTFDQYAVRLAQQIRQVDAATATVLPMDIRAAAEARHYTLDYLLAATDAAYFYLPVDERNAEQVLSQAAAGKERLQVVRWTADKHIAADEKEIVTFLVQTQAEPLDVESFPVYDVETFTLKSKTDFKLPSIEQPIGANFDDLLRLDAVTVPAVAAPGDWLPVALTLAPIGPMQADYRASVRLVGPDGRRVAQKDRTLRHNFHQGTSLWPPESVNEYYLLPVPPDVAPGEYTVTVVLYHPDTQAPLVADGSAAVPLGVVRIE